MRNINILAVGSKQDGYIKQGTAVFQKKLNRYCNFEFKVIKEANYSSGDQSTWLKDEAGRIGKAVKKGGLLVACDEKGKLYGSREFANQMIRWANRGHSTFNFVIGGPYGLSEEILKSADIVLSFSPMTMTHLMFRLFLMEQIYRSFTIINGEKYHHE